MIVTITVLVDRNTFLRRKWQFTQRNIAQFR